MNKHRVLIFLGPPGSGKGSLSHIAVKELGFKQISTGNLCRKHIVNQTEIGKEIDAVIKQGKLISDDLITGMVTDWFSNNSKNLRIILDGYPRTVAQAKAFSAFSDYSKLNISIVKLDVSDDKLIKRVESRIVCSNSDCQHVYSSNVNSRKSPNIIGICDDCSSELIKRKDDNLESITKRLKIYRDHESGLLDHFKDKSYNIYDISADQPLVDVYDSFVKKLGLI